MRGRVTEDGSGKPVRPVPPDRRRGGIPPDKVALEPEAGVVLDPRALQLPVASFGEDVVLDQVVPAVVLVEPAGGRPQHQVAAQDDAGRTLVGVEPPAAILPAGHVVNQVSLDHRPGRPAERVDAPQVGQHTEAERVDPIESDAVVVRRTLGITPDPAHGHARVGEVEDVAVLDHAVRRVADPDTHRGGVQAPPVGDGRVADRDPAHRSLRVVDAPRGAPGLRAAGGADQDTSGPEVEQLRSHDLAIAAARAEFQRVAAHLPDRHSREDHLARAGEHHRRTHVHFGLGKRLPGRRRRPVGVREGQSLEANLLDEPPPRQVAPHFQKPLQTRGEDARRVRLFARQRAIGEHARGTVEIPGTGCPQRLAYVLHQVAVPLGERTPLGERAGRTGERDRARGLVEHTDPHARHGPAVHRHHLDVVQIRPVRTEVAGRVDEPVVAALRVRLRRVRALRDPEPAGSSVGGRQPRPKPALIVHEELREVPVAGGHVLELQGPPGVRTGSLDGPAGEPAAAAEHGDRACLGPHNRGSFGGARVLGEEHHGFGQLVGSTGHLDHDRRSALRVSRP